MDENKEKELREDGVDELDTLSEQEKDEVSEILENLKKTKNDNESQPVTDWDGLAQVGGTDEEIIAETAEVNAEKNEENENSEDEDISEAGEEELCISCGKRKRYTELDEDYLYCKVCREKMKKTHLNGWGVVFFLITIVAAFIAVVWGVYAIGVSAPVIEGDKYMKEGKYRSALACYEEALSAVNTLDSQAGSGEPVFDAGRKTYAKVIEAYYKMGALVSAQDYAKSLEDTGAFDMAKYSHLKDYNKVLSGMSETCTYIQQKYQALFMTLQYSSEKADISTISKELKELDALKADSKYDKYAVAYMQVYLCQYVENSEDAQIKYLLEIKEAGKAYESIWASQLCMLYLEEGKYDEVKEICNDILKDSTESIEFYQFLMKAEIKQNNIKAALAVYKKAEKTVDEIYYSTEPLTMPYTLLAEKAVCHALLGEKEEALAAIDESFNLNVDIHTANVYALLHHTYHVKGTKPEVKDGKKIYDNVDTGYDMVLDLFANNDIELNKDVKAAIDGKKTLEDVFVNGEAYLK